MSIADRLRAAMPLLARHEGEWRGRYRYVTPAGEEVDAHDSWLVCAFRDDDEHPYHQTNANIWPDRRLDMEYPASFDGRGIVFDTPIIAGRFWETSGDPTGSTINGHWTWRDASMVPFPMTDMHMFEMIQLSADGLHRSRTWH